MARPALRERLSRPVLQCRRRCRHRAGHLHRRRRPGRARDLPDQPDPQPCRPGLRGAGPAAACLPGGRAGRRLAVLRGCDEPAAGARRVDSPRPLRRDGPPGEGRRPTTRGATRPSPTNPSASWTNSARTPPTAGPRTRPGNIRCRSGPISAHSCAPRASSSTDRALLQFVQYIEPQRARQVAAALRPAVVDLGHQGVERQAARLGEG